MKYTAIISVPGDGTNSASDTDTLSSLLPAAHAGMTTQRSSRCITPRAAITVQCFRAPGTGSAGTTSALLAGERARSLEALDLDLYIQVPSSTESGSYSYSGRFKTLHGTGPVLYVQW